MYVFEIITPGTWLESEDRDWSRKIGNLLQSLKSQYFEANLALNLFTEARSVRPSFADRENRERDDQRRSEIRQEVEQEYGGFPGYEHWGELHFETEVRLKREKWSNGFQPWEFEHNLPFIYARAFLYAIDSFDKFLGVLSREEGAPQILAELHAQIGEVFPDLRGVRNTAQHLEDRSRGLGAGRNPKPLNLKPVKNNMVSAPNGGVLILNSINGSKYGSTMADGHYGEVDVSPESMEILQKILQQTLEVFEWHGPKQHGPSA
jgi:hypothetical protein